MASESETETGLDATATATATATTTETTKHAPSTTSLEDMFVGDEAAAPPKAPNDDDDDEAEEERLRLLREAASSKPNAKDDAQLSAKKKDQPRRPPSSAAASASVDPADLVPGVLVWAKVKGYPWWPGRVEHEDALPQNIVKIKPKQPATPHVPILFCGTRDYGWMALDCLKLFEPHKDELSKKNKTVAFLNAVKEANNPDCLNTVKSSGKRKKDDDDLEDGAGDNDGDESATEGASGGAAKKKKVNNKDSSDAKAEKPKKEKKAPAPKKAVVKEEPPAPPKKEDNRSPEEKLKRLRSKLQFFLQNEHSTPEHHSRADKYLTDVEKFEVNVDLLLNTKIGKVMRRISEMQLENDTFNIVERSKKVVELWKSVIDA
ncbi:hypothetical protein HDU79_010910 [Rhizoclosmatium sp. JEL0117]|nr:hypothetical protein HDU79_010910 [Rhizoclosmatium sp. JEL0117]